MKVAKCMEDDSMHKKSIMPLVSQFNMKVNIKIATQTASGPKRSQQKKWDKNPAKDKGTLVEKKLRDIARVQCFNCNKLAQGWSKDYEKVK